MPEREKTMWFLTWHPQGNPNPYPKSGGLNGSACEAVSLLEAIASFEARGMAVVEGRKLGEGGTV